MEAEAFLPTKGTPERVLGHGSRDLFQRTSKKFAYTTGYLVVNPPGQKLANAAKRS